MSLQARQTLVSSKYVVWRDPAVQHADILDMANGVHTNCIALMLEMVAKRHYFYVTALRRDHPTVDGPLGHNPGGRCFDSWPLLSGKPGDFADPDSPQMDRFLADLVRSPWHRQTGLGGAACTAGDLAAASDAEHAAFPDNASDHVHAGAIE